MKQPRYPVIPMNMRSACRFIMVGIMLLPLMAACSQNNTQAGDKYRAGDNILRQKDSNNPNPWQRVIVRFEVQNLASIQEQAAKEKDPAKTKILDEEIRRRIREVADRIFTRIQPEGAKLVRRYDTLPLLGLKVSPEAKALLESMPDVLAIEVDQLKRPAQ